MIRVLRPLEFTQGTLFTCALAEAYPRAAVTGLIITARCDTEQNKTNVLNYLPVVPFQDWVIRDGVDILARRAEGDARSTMMSALKDAGLAPSILEIIDHSSIIAELRQDTGKKGQQIAARFSDGCDLLLRSRHLKNSYESSNITERKDFLDSRQAQAKILIRELLANSVAEFHYIPGLQPDDSGDGHVILLREVRQISINLGNAIATGLDYTAYNVFKSELLRWQLAIESEEDFSMPLGAVDSPYIELIMQRFSQLFSRIGVADIPKERMLALQAVISNLRDVCA